MWIPGVKNVKAIRHARYRITIECVILEIQEHRDCKVQSEGSKEDGGTFADQMPRPPPNPGATEFGALVWGATNSGGEDRI
jgi:hypothetical protein